MRGLDAEVMAYATSVDPAPLSPAGELAALLAGRRTYTLTWVPGRARYEIDVRFPDHIEFRPPGSSPHADVVVSHECHADPLPIMHTSHLHAARNKESEEVPF